MERTQKQRATENNTGGDIQDGNEQSKREERNKTKKVFLTKEKIIYS